jgi:ABC-2 type transport system permease protein
VRLDWEIARRGYRRYAAYPAATFAGAFTNTVFGFMKGYVLLAVFADRARVGGYDTADTLTYVWLAQALIMTVYAFAWFDVALRIRSGDIAGDLTRPLDPLRYWLAFDLGRSLYHFVFRGIPPFIVGALAFDLRFPEPGLWIAFLASVTLGVVVSFAFRFLYNVASFWLIDYRGAGLLAMIVALLFSGFIVPISFFPDWLAAVAHALPFAAIVQTPIDVFLGKHTGLDLIGTLALQAGWAVALLGLARVVLAAGTRRLVIQGG